MNETKKWFHARTLLSVAMSLGLVLMGSTFSEVVAQAKPYVGDSLPAPTGRPGCKLVGSIGTGGQQKVFEVCKTEKGDVKTEVDPDAIPEGARIDLEPTELEPSQAGDVATAGAGASRGDYLPPPTAKPGCKLIGSGGTGPGQKVFEVCPGDEGEVRTQVDPEAAEKAAEASGTKIEIDPALAADVQKGVAQVGETPPAVPPAEPEAKGLGGAILLGTLAAAGVAGIAVAVSGASSSTDTKDCRCFCSGNLRCDATHSCPPSGGVPMPCGKPVDCSACTPVNQ